MLRDLIVFALGAVVGGVVMALVYHNNLKAAQEAAAAVQDIAKKV